MSDRVSRPLGVTLVFLILLVSGALAIVSGVWRLVNRGDNIGWIPGLVTVALGLVYVYLAKGIANGSSAARYLVALATACMLILCGWGIILDPGLWAALSVQILLGLIVIALLYSARAKQFFRN